jgi:hypothetical protein
MPADISSHAAHRERLKAPQARLRAFHDALSAHGRNLHWIADALPPFALPTYPTVYPACQSPAIPLADPRGYCCLSCRAEWVMHEEP